MKTLPTRTRVRDRLCLIMICGLVLFGDSAPAAQKVIFEPGGAHASRRPEGLTWRVGGGNLLYLYFDTPAILQATTDLPSGQWENVARASPHRVHFRDEHPTTHFRVVSAERPVTVLVPDSYDPTVPAPLVISLHGHGSSAELQSQYMDFLPMAETYGFLYCAPEGIRDPNGVQFWNASASCSDAYGDGVDDGRYLRELVQTAGEVLNVDSKRIYFVGISSGAFMAHRMAREHSDIVAAAACLAGTMSVEDTCTPSHPVNILQLHGTVDSVMRYNGGSHSGLSPYLGAEATIERWAAANGCQSRATDSGPRLDLVRELAGADTSITRYELCPRGGAVELWTIHGGSHVPDFPSMSGVLLERIVEWLLEHPKPGSDMSVKGEES